MSLTRLDSFNPDLLNSIVKGDAGRRLFTTIEQRSLDQRYVQGWKFSSLFFRLCWLHVSVTIGITASIFLVFNDDRISVVARNFIQAVGKSLGVYVLSFFLVLIDFRSSSTYGVAHIWYKPGTCLHLPLAQDHH